MSSIIMTELVEQSSIFRTLYGVALGSFDHTSFTPRPEHRSGIDTADHKSG